MMLCDLYLKRFDLTKGLLFDTFVIVLLWSLSIGVQMIFATDELVDKIKNFKYNASPNDWKEKKS